MNRPRTEAEQDRDVLVREFNAMVLLFDSRTLGMGQRMDPAVIYRAMLADPAFFDSLAARFRAVCIGMGYAMLEDKP